jgi:hypothetical protein
MRAMLSRVTLLALAVSFLIACGGTDADPIGDACEDYCTLVMRNCQGGVAQYPDVSTCTATCEAMELGTVGARDGNTIHCRTFWAAIAEGDPTTCTRAGPGGDGTCGTNCQSFCATTLSLCSSEPNPPYSSTTECESMCPSYDATEVFDASDLAGNTLACRIYHMTAASTDPGTHCAHTVAASPVCI